MDMLVIKRACPLNERLARERTARQICRKNQFPRSLLRIKFPRPIDNYAAEAAVQAIRILPECPQQAKKRLIRTVFVQRGCKKQPTPRRRGDLLRRKFFHTDSSQRLRQQALQPRTAANTHQRQFLFHGSI